MRNVKQYATKEEAYKAFLSDYNKDLRRQLENANLYSFLAKLSCPTQGFANYTCKPEPGSAITAEMVFGFYYREEELRQEFLAQGMSGTILHKKRALCAKLLGKPLSETSWQDVAKTIRMKAMPSRPVRK